jgi:hypothetical protein
MQAHSGQVMLPQFMMHSATAQVYQFPKSSDDCSPGALSMQAWTHP